MSSFKWCKIHKVTSHGKCHICVPTKEIVIIDVSSSIIPNHSNLPSIESVLLISKLDWTEEQWTAWRVWNASKNSNL